jgi:hypothetical protein
MGGAYAKAPFAGPKAVLAYLAAIPTASQKIHWRANWSAVASTVPYRCSGKVGSPYEDCMPFSSAVR